MNRGALLLQRHFQKQSTAAERLHISQSMLARVLSGERKPGRRLALSLQRDFGIPIDAWEDDIEDD